MVDNSDALTYLKRFRPSAKVLGLCDLSDTELKSLPDSWVDILSKDGDKRLDQALIYWNKFEKEFALMIELLKANLVSIHLINTKNGFCLMYGVLTFVENKVDFYETRNPKRKINNDSIAAEWSRLPLAFRQFYEFHDGWYDLASGSMGLSNRESMNFMNTYIIGETEVRGYSLAELSKFLTIFSNGAGGYLCADFSKEEVSYLLWWHDDEPNLNVKLWPIVDSWTFKGLDY
ncbi:hypothetical protein OA92_13420 [Marinomonas sp. SBI22]|uniref:SMI1/KNR4 family protein n=1 Tax=unclassified Marinomonas TaxID=196814 RepID=UPI0007AF97F1|nr:MULTISPECIES: SMI1/KNR4 family protein [unclassified Marinomonas]KZM41411.1 hypothetical protein OA92_13420 [Marinomonas sp. SBI22]KZM43247.1 hypothetical protein OA91_11625 [Marinomonas sp. SBI8L]